jgi:hypothetical protein
MTVFGQITLRTVQGKLQGLALPVYLDLSSPATVVRADSVSREHQRRGFFRIGALPLLVCEGVTVEFTFLIFVEHFVADFVEKSQSDKGLDKGCD